MFRRFFLVRATGCAVTRIIFRSTVLRIIGILHRNMPMQACLSGTGCCGAIQGNITPRTANSPRIMACLRRGSPLFHLRCRFAFSDELLFTGSVTADMLSAGYESQGSKEITAYLSSRQSVSDEGSQNPREQRFFTAFKMTRQ